MSYKLKLEVFEGPLDLLLYLIKKNEVNIYNIPIAKVTEQYLEYLELMKLLDLEIVGEFLVIAATLIQIKSRMLLPQEKIEETTEEVDPRQELVERLLEYNKFKEIAEELRRKELSRQNFYLRPSQDIPEKEQAKQELYFEASVFDLISAFSNAMKDIPREVFYEVIKDEFTLEQKIHDILHTLLVQPEMKLSELFKKAKNKFEIVSSFLAILELIRLKEILVLQKELFGEIKIVRNKENILPYGRRNPPKTINNTGN